MAETIKIAAVGDIFLGRRMLPQLRTLGAAGVLERVRSFLTPCDLALGNLECVVSEQTTAPTGPEILVMPPEYLAALRDINIRAVTLANNHTMDLGAEGLADTLRALDGVSIASVGAGLSAAEASRPLIVETALKIGILSYFGTQRAGRDGGVNGASLTQMLEDVAALRQRAAIVVVAVHWGVLDQATPMRHQVQTAHRLIDAGVDLVVGSGPHTLMPVERYGKGVVAYSLGNFVFDAFPERRRESCILVVTASAGAGVSDVEIVPIVNGEDFVLCPVGADRPELHRRISALLVDGLAKVGSDGQIARKLLRHARRRPLQAIKRFMRAGGAARPLGFYLKSLAALLREKLR